MSLNIPSLYFFMTPSRSAVYMRATRPPSGVIPLRSPIPSTDVSMCVAPASRAAYAFAIEQLGEIYSVPSVIVEMAFNVTADYTFEGSNQLVDLSRVSAPYGVSDSYTVDSQLNKYTYIPERPSCRGSKDQPNRCGMSLRLKSALRDLCFG